MTITGRPPTAARLGRTIELAVILDAIPVGGVEVFLRNLFAHLDPDVVRPRVYCLREAGPLAEEFRAGGFAVEVVARSGPRELRACRVWLPRCGEIASTPSSSPNTNARR